MNSDLRRRLKTLANDLTGPLGPMPFDRAVRRHLALFEDLRRSEYTWAQIARALSSAGIRRANGEIYPAERLRAAVFRQMKRHASAAREPASLPRKTQRCFEPGKVEPLGKAHQTTKVAAAKPEKSADLSSIQAKLARVAKMRGG